MTSVHFTMTKTFRGHSLTDPQTICRILPVFVRNHTEVSMEVGKKYRFEPAVRAIGIQGEGNATRRYPNLLFKSGTCVKIGEHVHEFRGVVDGQVYKFFTLPKPGGSKAILVADTPNGK